MSKLLLKNICLITYYYMSYNSQDFGNFYIILFIYSAIAQYFYLLTLQDEKSNFPALNKTKSTFRSVFRVS